jgi:cbb3-type cytochrome oxidase maturation protein
MLWYVVSSIVMGLAGVLVYLYYLKQGQFQDPEDVKYQMFRNEENEK